MAIRSQWHVIGTAQPACVDDVLDLLLKNRGVSPSFLNCTLKDLEPHVGMCGMDAGAELMARHLLAGHRIVLVGDYDCDGVTALAQMTLFLKDIGYTNYGAVIPSRAEGYGVPERAATAYPDAKLLVAMDCGTLDVRSLTMVRNQGADVLVIDHHEVPEQGLAPATVLINPKQPSCPSAFKDFCASGLTLLFLTRLRRALQGRFETPSLGGKYLALATVGTVADMVPLVEGNRILARGGLASLNTQPYAPLRQLALAAGLSGKAITAGHLGYYVGPRINAAGRVADARLAFELLVADQPREIAQLAQELNRLNAKRQQQEDQILSGIRARMAQEPSRGRTVVLGDPEWPSGIIGIVASRIQQEIHYGPVIVFSVDEEKGIARGSARSVSGFDIHGALQRCQDLLIKWGGHKMAAGMTIALDRMEQFKARFEEVAQGHPDEVFIPKGRVDMELDLGLVSVELLDALKQLEPHGLGNPVPTFAVRGTRVRVRKAFGRDQSHLRLLLDGRIGAVYWRGAQHFQSGALKDGLSMDVIFQVEWDDFSKEPMLNIKDMGQLL